MSQEQQQIRQRLLYRNLNDSIFNKLSSDGVDIIVDLINPRRVDADNYYWMGFALNKTPCPVPLESDTDGWIEEMANEYKTIIREFLGQSENNGIVKNAHFEMEFNADWSIINRMSFCGFCKILVTNS